MFSRSVRPSSAERTQPLPGDTFIPDAIAALTHAITIHRAPYDVWPWLAQMGAGTRAGWYSYDILDNGRRPSARCVRPDLQHVDFGMIMPALPGTIDGFTVLAYDRDHFLVIGWRDGDGMLLMTWTFVLEETPEGGTRLIVRARRPSISLSRVAVVADEAHGARHSFRDAAEAATRHRAARRSHRRP